MAKKKGGKKKGRRPPPVCKAILLCESTITEAETGFVSIIRVIESLVQPKFPSNTMPFELFLQLTNGIGEYVLSVEIYDLTTDNFLGRAQFTQQFETRLTTININVHVEPIPLEHPGVYDVIVKADGQEIDRQQFRAVVAEEKENGDEQEPDQDDPIDE